MKTNMKNWQKSILTIAAAAATLMSSAKADTWGSWVASGTSCNNYNVQVLSGGDTASILFDDFGINMPSGSMGDGLVAQKTCNFRIQLTPPRGFYLGRLRQVFSGGVLKSTGSQSKLDVRYFIGGSFVQMMNPLIFSASQAISPSNPSSVYTRTVNDNLLVYACGGTTTYGLNMKLQATRSNVSQYLLTNLDSVETSFKNKVDLVPEWLACP